jgi:hypothetical protein
VNAASIQATLMGLRRLTSRSSKDEDEDAQVSALTLAEAEWWPLAGGRYAYRAPSRPRTTSVDRHLVDRRWGTDRETRGELRSRRDIPARTVGHRRLVASASPSGPGTEEQCSGTGDTRQTGTTSAKPPTR